MLDNSKQNRKIRSKF